MEGQGRPQEAPRAVQNAPKRGPKSGKKDRFAVVNRTKLTWSMTFLASSVAGSADPVLAFTAFPSGRLRTKSSRYSARDYVEFPYENVDLNEISTF